MKLQGLAPMMMSNHPIKNSLHDIESSVFYPRYLAAKKSVDDRSLNRHVWRKLLQLFQDRKTDSPSQILELGAGIGTMFTRMIDWGLLKGSASYTITDNDPRHLETAQDYLSLWAKKNNHSLTWSEKFHGQLLLEDDEIHLLLDIVDIERITSKTYLSSSYDLIIAHALLDLVDFSTVLPALFSLLSKDGLAYLTCNFNGETHFLPGCDVDQEIIKSYHDSMEKRLKGASSTGKNLLHYFLQQKIEIKAAGSSDWIVHPQKNTYHADEEFFLHAIIEMVERELTKKDCQCPSIADWVDLRHRQAENGQLMFLASHLDFLVCH